MDIVRGMDVCSKSFDVVVVVVVAITGTVAQYIVLQSVHISVNRITANRGQKSDMRFSDSLALWLHCTHIARPLTDTISSVSHAVLQHTSIRYVWSRSCDQDFRERLNVSTVEKSALSNNKRTPDRSKHLIRTIRLDTYSLAVSVSV